MFHGYAKPRRGNGSDGQQMKLDFEMIRKTRAENPQRIAEAYAKRERRELLPADGKLMIVAADHPARGALRVGDDHLAMAHRYQLLESLAIALTRDGVDGVLATPDIIDDLVLLGLLDNKIVVGSMNRGGLAGAIFEIDDRFTAYSIQELVEKRLDFAKTLNRIDLSDSATADMLETTAQVIDEASANQLPIMLEPFMSNRAGGTVTNELTAEAMIKAVAISAGLGASSAYTWLKIPVVENMEAVMESTTLPTLLLGGDNVKNQETLVTQWESALELPGVRGLVAGRALLFPHQGSVEQAVDSAVELVH